MVKLTGLAFIGLLLLFGAVAGYVRLAPVSPSRWHVDLLADRPPELRRTPQTQGADLVQVLPDGAYLDSPSTPDEAKALLLALDARAMATPRTRRIAGSPEEGHVTWETRSLIWGFPDYTTAQVTDAGLTVYARARFGLRDLGVNAARLRDWLTPP